MFSHKTVVRIKHTQQTLSKCCLSPSLIHASVKLSDLQILIEYLLCDCTLIGARDLMRNSLSPPRKIPKSMILTLYGTTLVEKTDIN